MGQEGPKISARFGILDRIIHDREYKKPPSGTDSEQQRLGVLAEKGIYKGATVSYKRKKDWTVVDISDGYLDLRRVISGNAVVWEKHVSPRAYVMLVS